MNAEQGIDTEETQPSGRVYMAFGKIVWLHKGEVLCEIEVKDIQLVGEYTTDEGPVINDWFLVFILSEDNVMQIPLYVNGREAMLQYLSQFLGAEVAPRLVGSAGCATTLLWPPEVAGKPMWDLEELAPVTFGEKLKALVGLGKPTRIHLTPDALSVLGSATRSPRVG